jgi:predicted glycosyltransferase
MEAGTQSVTSSSKRIWIDLDNSPHIPFFAPIIEELKGRGYSVMLTARDAYQVCELADFFGFNYQRVGQHYGKHKLLKVLGTCIRAIQLLSIVMREKPDLAVAHGSRSQLIVSSLLGIPSLAIFDYEFAKGLQLFHPTWLMVPEVLPIVGDPRNVLRYPGIKEDVYVPRFKPNSSIKSELGLDENHIVVTVRPPATEAHYHNHESDRLFEATIEFLCGVSGVKVIVVPRNGRQAVSLRASWRDFFLTGKLMIPEHTVDGLNLIWHSDLVISGGGTMNREAAALGVPVYSIFRGKIGAVDRYLTDNGRLVLLENVEDVRTKIILERRRQPVARKNTDSITLTKIVDDIVTISESNSRLKRP